jgi:UDP-2,3-diacylglucosamine pyrophosphatase LpxH
MVDIFLSDIHIGINAKTNLYQREEHEPGLKAILRYIQENGEQIRNVVILGDWIDLWMYTTTARPVTNFSADSAKDDILPTVEQIIQANPNVFTEQKSGSGDFVTVTRKITGKVHYIIGNHDQGVTSEAINSFLPDDLREKRSIICKSEPYKFGQLYGEHGHLFSMVCKPSCQYPFGYFMTRAAADAGVKAPENVFLHLLEYTLQDDSFATAMLKTIAAQQTEKKFNYLDFRFVMPDSTTLSAQDVIDMFPNNPSDFNLKEFIKTDLILGVDNLTHSAHERYLQDPTRKIVLMGHTHKEKVYPNTQPQWIYANTGFLCGEKGLSTSSFLTVDINADGSDASAVDEYKIAYDADGTPVIRKLLWVDAN